MKLEFNLLGENKTKFKDDIQEITEYARQKGLIQTEFGVYEGVIPEEKMDDICFFIMLKKNFLRHCSYVYLYFDKDNHYKEDLIKAMKTVRKRNHLDESF